MPRRQPISLNRLGFGIIVAVVGVVIIFAWSLIQGWWGQGISPLGRVSHWLSNMTSSKNSAALTAERDSLRKQIDALHHQLATAQDQLQAGRSLTQLEAFVQSSHRKMVTASVVTANPDDGLHTIVLDRGAKDGLKIGMAVTTPSGTVIGKIFSVHDHVSAVLLITDSQSALAARIDNDQHSPGVIIGEHGLSLRLSFVPKTDNVVAGQVVVTSGTEQNVPAGLVIGSVGSTSSRSGDVFQTATISSPIEVAGLPIVGVITE